MAPPSDTPSPPLRPLRALRRLAARVRPLPTRLPTGALGALDPFPRGGALVGGAVRDLLLGLEPTDLDFVAPDPRAAAEEAAAALGGSAFPLDEARGHWRVVVRDGRGGRDGKGARERDYAPVAPGGLEADLRARDATVNAVALLEDGRLVDPTGGRRDLRERMLRMTSRAALEADPLRPLRVARLATTRGLEPDPATALAVREIARAQAEARAPLPSPERVRDELDRLLAHPNAARGLAAMDAWGLLDAHLPELAAMRGVEQGGFHHRDVLGHSLEALHALLHRFPDAAPALRWATLLHDVGKPLTREAGEDGRTRFYGHDREGAEIALRLLRRLRQPEALARRAAELVRRHMLPLPRDDRSARRFAHRRRALLPDLLKLMIADREAARGPLSNEATRRAYRLALARIVAILEEEPERPPPLDGREVMEALGLEPGPRVGEALRFLAEAQAEGDVRSREEALEALRGYAEARGW